MQRLADLYRFMRVDAILPYLAGSTAEEIAAILLAMGDDSKQIAAILLALRQAGDSRELEVQRILQRADAQGAGGA